MNNFEGKVAVITGAGRGIGKGIALRCAQEGMKVVLSGIRLDPLNKTAAELNKLGAETLIVQADVSLEADVENLAEKSYEAFGAVHLLVNNAGVGSPGNVWEASMDDWNWVMSVNFFGVLYGVRAFIPRMIEQGTEGHIVNVSSVAGLLEGGGGSYGVSKHAVVALTEALYHNLAEAAPNINVSAYCPGYVNSELDQVDSANRPRPARFSKNASKFTDEMRQGARETFENKGLSIEESANVLFEGIKAGKLYIGVQAFSEQMPRLGEAIHQRAENIVTEQNPAHPRMSVMKEKADES
ncbi:SDR family NAD(P)-dependent oxidoreductase [Candidatus Leptofilum sp.]|uniref:SDR family NAD(P)-dependent oxidoreductase n=1 Tax=Candidatus Leptofilum sp. TaxID=3241576 RepID=UPI003B5AD2BB